METADDNTFAAPECASTASAACTVALVGMPGSGKSSAGAQLARRLGLAFYDSDQWIEAQRRQSVSSIFAELGEAAFRDMEAQALRELLRRDGCVLATGGGAVLRPANRQLLRAHAWVVYLRSSPEQLWRRLRGDVRRPLLQVADPLQRLRDMHAERDELYRACAHFVVNTHGLSLPMLVWRMVLNILKIDHKNTDFIHTEHGEVKEK